MKMKSGPKAFLFILFAIVFTGFGYWAGRGFPQTWQGVLPQSFTTSASPASSVGSRRIDDLEARTAQLEKEVAALKTILGPVGQLPSSEPYPLSRPPMPGEIPLSSGPGSPEINAPVEVP